MKNNYLYFFALTLSAVVFTRATNNTGSITGNVVDGDSYLKVPGAIVSLGDSLLRTVTDSAGHYVIPQIPPGTYTVEASKNGYSTFVKYSVVVNPHTSTPVDFPLTMPIRDLDKMVVTGVKRRVDKEAGTALHTLDMYQIADQPAGNYDLQRALSTLPAFAGGFDETNDIVVIGGNYGENLFLIDGIEVFNPNHFSGATESGGSFSVIDPALVERMNFYAGAFPARYGKKAASVLSIDLRKGAEDRVHVKIDAGVAGAGGTVEGPLGGGSFLLTGHRSFTELIYKMVMPELVSAPEYTSIVGKYDIEPATGQRLSILGVFAFDNSREKGPTWDWSYKGNQQVAGVNHFADLGPFKLRSNLSFVRQRSDGDELNNAGLHNYFDYFTQSATTARTNFSGKLFDAVDIEIGGAVARMTFDHNRFRMGDSIWHYQPGTDSITGLVAAIPPINYDDHLAFMTGEGYIQASSTIGGIFTPAAGARIDYYGYTHETVLSPRASLTLHLRSAIDVSLAGGRHRQPPDAYTLLRDDRNRDLKSRYADHAVFGIKHTPIKDLSITFEGFYKRYRQIPISEAEITPDPLDWSQRYVNEGKSRTIGGDIFIEKQLKKHLWGSLSYSYAESKWYDPRDPSRMFDADLDYRHHLSGLIGYRQKYREAAWFKQIGRNWWYRILKIIPFIPADESDYSLRCRFLGGKPYTPMHYDSTIRRWRTDEMSPYNSQRIPPYFRLDFHLKERIFSGKVSVITYLEALNITGHQNLFWFLYRDDTAEKVERYQMPRVVLGGVIVEY